jgi:carboxypeptidase Q
MRSFRLALVGLLSMTVHAAAAAPPVDALTMERIADAGFNHGQVVPYVEYLSDNIGGRLTNSPAMREAERWTQAQFQRAGLKNVHPEGFEFGRGWWIESASVQMLTPRPLALRSIPVAWTPPTNGTLSAPIAVAPIRSERDLAQYKGQLQGKIVLLSLPEDPKDETEAPFQRLSEAEILRQDHYELPHTDDTALAQSLDRFVLAEKVDAFLAAEGAVAWARMSIRPGSLVHGEGYRYQVGHTPILPGVELGAEDYRRLARLAKKGPVTLAINSRVHYEDSDTQAYNVIADLPGRDPKAGYVMAGAHLDSWVAADGAADNGAGSAVVMEAARILASLNITPKRTIRFALWSGEEQGLHGSAHYIEQHIAHWPLPTDPVMALGGAYRFWDGSAVEPLPGYQDLVAYFNIDNGSGKVRGIHAEGNFGATHLLREWLAPLSSLNAASVVASPTGGTDHVLFSRLGLPAFQFVQDPLDYNTRVHHSNVDTFDHLRADDLRQAAVVLATLLLDAANADYAMPRKPLPTKPEVTDPYRYSAPATP